MDLVQILNILVLKPYENQCGFLTFVQHSNLCSKLNYGLSPGIFPEGKTGKMETQNVA